MADRQTLINERKKTSEAYKGWQNAIALRDKVIMEVGSDNQAYRRTIELVKTWHDRWITEMNAIDAEVSDTLLEAIEMAEKESANWGVGK